MEATARRTFDRPPPSLISQIHIVNQPPEAEIQNAHVVCVILDPWLKNIAWVFNFSYPAGKWDAWGLPGGRRDKNDRTLWHTAAREAEEETGITVKNLGLILEGSVYDTRTDTYFWRAVFLCVAATPGDPAIQARDEKTGALQTRGFRWFPRGIAPSIGQTVDGKVVAEKVYPTHAETIIDPYVTQAIERAENSFGDDVRALALNEPWQRVAQQHLSS